MQLTEFLFSNTPIAIVSLLSGGFFFYIRMWLFVCNQFLHSLFLNWSHHQLCSETFENKVISNLKTLVGALGYHL